MGSIVTNALAGSLRDRLTVVALQRRRAPLAAAVFALGCAALAARPMRASSLIATAIVGVAGLLVGIDPAARASRARWAGVTAAGIAIFAATRAFGDAAPPRATLVTVGGAVVAAIAEEAFFRRGLQGWLERYGAAIAIVAPALAFGAIHVSWYGLAVLPLDVAAGLVLGWQRWATGSWTSAAATHAVANLVTFL